MSDRYRVPGEGAPTSGGASRYSVPATPETRTEDPIQQIIQSPEFQRLARVNGMFQQSLTDPSIGDPNRLRSQMNLLTSQLTRKFDVNASTIGDLVSRYGEEAAGGASVAGSQSAGSALQPLLRQGANAVGAALGVMEPVMALGDTSRTFLEQLSEVQGARDARQEGVPYVPGSGEGSPASTPWQALWEMGVAGYRTFGEMGGDEFPVRQSETGEGILGLEGNPESGWFVYTPNFKWGERGIGVSPYEAGLAPTGRELVERFRLDEQLGIESERGKEVLGVVFEVLSDPLLAGDFASLGARGLGLTARVTGSTSARQAAGVLDQFADDLYRVVTPKGAANIVGGAARAVNPGFVDSAMAAMTKGINDFLNFEIPGGANIFLRNRGAVAGALGFGEDLPNPRVRDLLFQNGHIQGLGGQPFKFLSGSEETGLSLGERAFMQERQMREIAVRGASAISDALTDGLPMVRGARFWRQRITAPAARFVREDMQPYVAGLGAVVRDFVEMQGPGRAGIPDSVMSRLEDVSRLFDQPMEETLRRFERATAATRGVTVQAGYAVSGYEDYVTAMQRASRVLDVPYPDIRRAYERVVGGVDLQQLEVDDFFDLVRPGSTGAKPATREAQQRARPFMDDFRNEESGFREAWESALRDELEAMGRTDLAGVDPVTYLTSLREGYLRRNFFAVEHPEVAINALKNNDIILVPAMDREGLASRVGEALGDDAARTVEQFINVMTPARPRNLTPAQREANRSAVYFNTRDLAKSLTRSTGRRVTEEEVVRLVRAGDPDMEYLNETLAIAGEYARQSSARSGVGTPLGLTPSRFQQREQFDIEDIVQRLVVQDPVQAVTQLGRTAGRAVRSQNFIGNLYDELKSMGMLMDGSSFPQVRVNDDFIVPFERGKGEKWVALPRNRSVWGPLAGQAIPADVARMTLYTIQHGGGDRGSWGRLFSMMRRGLISPLSTSLRNVLSNFILINQAGGNLPDMLQNLPEANRMRRLYRETGRLPGELRGYEHLFGFLDTGTMSGISERGMDDALELLARGDHPIERRIERAINFLDEATQVQATTPWLGGFLNFFKYGEEVSRLSAFLTKRDELLRAGIQTEEALNRAAHFAANAAYNYGATPLLPDVLKRTGLAAFPQFTWFTMGRTPRVLMENPQALARLEYGRRLANEAIVPGGEEEEISITGMTAGWLQHTHPFAFPIPNEDGNYYMFDFSYMIPQGANVQDLVREFFSGGLMSPVVDLAWSWMGGDTGSGPIGARFGQRWYNASDTPTQRLGTSVAQLGSQVLFPGAWRGIRQTRDMLQYNRNRDEMDFLTMLQDRYHNADVAQYLGRLVGLNMREVSVRADGQSIDQRLRDVNRKYESVLADLANKKEELLAAMAAGNSPERRAEAERQYEALTMREVRIKEERALERARLWEMTR